MFQHVSLSARSWASFSFFRPHTRASPRFAHQARPRAVAGIRWRGDYREGIRRERDEQAGRKYGSTLPPPMQKFKPMKKKSRIQLPKDKPSAASGGVPEPTAAYLEQASQPPVRLLPSVSPRPILVVLDLNDTLLHRLGAARRFVLRPHAVTFLNYCIDTFWVAIWSSSQPENVELMCRQLMTPPYQERLVAAWDRTSYGLTHEDYRKRTQCYKRLSMLWDDPKIAASHPDYANGGRWSQANTVLIDDSDEKARSEPYNLIQVPEFLGTESVNVLPQVHDYINELCVQQDVSAYMRTSPFSLQGLKKSKKKKAKPDFPNTNTSA